MGIFSKPTEKLLDFFFSVIGFREPLIDNDRHILPFIKKALEETSFADLEIGGRVPGRYYEHAVRYLGKDHIVKFVTPEPENVMRAWLKELRDQKTILERFVPHNLPAFSYFYVPFSSRNGVASFSSRQEEAAQGAAATGEKNVAAPHQNTNVAARPWRAKEERALKGATSRKATYALVMEKIEGRPLYQLTDEEIFSNRDLVENLAEFLEGNREMRKKQGIFADLVGGPAPRILNPRYTGNLYVTDSNEVKLVDTVLIPASFDPKTTPVKYRLAKLYHFCYRTLLLPRERHFHHRLKNV